MESRQDLVWRGRDLAEWHRALSRQKVERARLVRGESILASDKCAFIELDEVIVVWERLAAVVDHFLVRLRRHSRLE